MLGDISLQDVRDTRDLKDVVGMTLWKRVIGAWVDMRASTRLLINERPNEARLLFFVLLSDVLFFLARTLSLVVVPNAATEQFLPLEVGIWLIGVFVLRTAILYVFSGMIGVIGRALGGAASFRETRTAVFWASLVAAPVGVAGALIGAGFGRLAPHVPLFATDAFVIGPLVLGPVAFVWFISASVAEAHKARHTSLVFISFSVLALAFIIAAIAISTQL